MAFHDDEEKDKGEGEVPEDALDEVLDEDDDDDIAEDETEEEKDWA
jgi:hypothetical protein